MRDFDSKIIQDCCRAMTKLSGNPKWSKYSERWVQIKFYMVGKDKWTDPWLTDMMEMKIQGLARLASKCFDEHFYKPGKRRTNKDNIYYSKHKYARHNFPNYNFSIQMFHLIIGGIDTWKEYKAWLFFPLLKTPGVILRLHQIWQHICEYNYWPLWDIGKQIDTWPLDADGNEQPPLPEMVYDYSQLLYKQPKDTEIQYITMTTPQCLQSCIATPEEQFTAMIQPPNSEYWEEGRRKLWITGSNLCAVLPLPTLRNSWTRAPHLWQPDMVNTQSQRPCTISRNTSRTDPFVSSLMAMGRIQEPYARQLFGLISSQTLAFGQDLTLYTCSLYVHRDYPWTGATPDSLVRIRSPDGTVRWYVLEIKCKQGQNMVRVQFQPGYYTQCVAEMECVQSRVSQHIEGCYFFQVNFRTGEWMLELIRPNPEWFGRLIKQSIRLAALVDQGIRYNTDKHEKSIWTAEWAKIEKSLTGSECRANFGDHHCGMYPAHMVLDHYRQCLDIDNQGRHEIDKCLIHTGSDESCDATTEQ